MLGLKLAREMAGLTQKEAAEKLGIPVGTLRNWEQGINKVSADRLKAFVALYKTPADVILDSQYADTIRVALGQKEDAFVSVPLYGAIAAGTPIEMVESLEMVDVPRTVMEQYPDAFLLQVKGESMNHILPNGSYALIDPCDDVDYDNKPYAVCVNGYNATIKRVRKLENGFMLVPDSTDPTFRPRVFDYNEPETEVITIIGRVVYYVLPYDWSF